jgi:hypothetical protein
MNLIYNKNLIKSSSFWMIWQSEKCLRAFCPSGALRAAGFFGSPDSVRSGRSGIGRENVTPEVMSLELEPILDYVPGSTSMAWSSDQEKD